MEDVETCADKCFPHGMKGWIFVEYLIGVDLGTSGTKTVLFDTEGSVIASKTIEYPLYQERKTAGRSRTPSTGGTPRRRSAPSSRKAA